MKSKSGFVLSLVLGILAVLTIFFTALLKLPGGLRRYVFRAEKEIQSVYNAESGILAHLQNLPEGLLSDVPKVEIESAGPYEKICARDSLMEVCGFAVSEYEPLGYREFHDGVFGYRQDLYQRISQAPTLHRYSGNRRFFSKPEYDYIQIQDGDLLLDIYGYGASLNFLVSGNATLKGDAVFDTLRLYSMGNAEISGNIRVNHLEIVAGESIEIKDGAHIEFRGLLTALQEIRLGKHTYGKYPSFAIALGKNSPSVYVQNGRNFEGAAFAPTGTVKAGETILNPDSAKILPAFLGNRKVVFDRQVHRE